MPRNLYERVEMMFPVRDAMVRQRVLHEMLEVYLADTLKSRLLQSDGSYTRPPRPPRSRGFDAQEFLIGLAEGKQTLQALAPKARRQRAAKPRAAQPETGEVAGPKPESGS
jgi:polyphosphate kinase